MKYEWIIKKETTKHRSVVEPEGYFTSTSFYVQKKEKHFFNLFYSLSTKKYFRTLEEAKDYIIQQEGLNKIEEIIEVTEEFLNDTKS